MADQLQLHFKGKKSARRAEHLLRNFASEKRIIFPKTRDQLMGLMRERGLRMQYRSELNEVPYFPTDEGWAKFLEYVDELHGAEPFATRCTSNDVFQAFATAMGTILKGGMLPDCTADLLPYLPTHFVQDVTTRSETRCFGLGGLEVETYLFVRVGSCWVGKFGAVQLQSYFSEKEEFRAQAHDALMSVFKTKSPVIVCPRIFGSSDKVKARAVQETDTTLSILAVLYTLTYEYPFSRLRTLYRIDSPYRGLAKHFEFSFVSDTGNTSSLSFGTQFENQRFKLNEEVVERWYDDLFLARLNQIAYTPEAEQNDIEQRIVRALHYYRHATLPESKELQIATLWIPVECFFTLDSKPGEVSKRTISSFSAIIFRTIRNTHWPGEASSLTELRSEFTKLYKHRSQSSHHAKIGHVSNRDVDNFSLAVASLIITMTQLSDQGFTEAGQVREVVERDLERLAPLKT